MILHSLCCWAHKLGRDQIASLLEANLKEEKEADKKLTQLGEAACNVEAMQHDTEKKSEATATVKKIVSSGP